MSDTLSPLVIATQAARKPTSASKVHREECVQCWTCQDDVDGVFCCVTCFSGGCLDHFKLHASKKGHRVALWIHRKPLPVKKAPAPVPADSKKIVFNDPVIEYETETKWAIFPQNSGGQLTWFAPSQELSDIAECILAAPSDTADTFSSAFELVPEPCPHTVTLEQIPNPPILDRSLLSHCNDCQLDNNLWLCLTSGHLGCGRKLNPKFYGHSGGNNHAIDFWQNTKYPVVVRMGTITPEGDASVYCYKCDEDVTDPYIGKHLAHFGINVAEQVKTEKSIIEQTRDLNEKFDFSTEWEAGKKAQRLSGPGFTGLQNLGNSCYLSSTAQLLFHTPGFKEAFNNPNHFAECKASSPSECPICQFYKIYIGINQSKWAPIPLPKQQKQSAVQSESGKSEATPADETETETSEPDPRSHPPRAFKKLVAGNHPEFSKGRQQDSHEYMLHLLDFVDKNFKKNNPSNQFSTRIEIRRQCTKCKNVNYSYTSMHSLILDLDRASAQKRPSSLIPELPESLQKEPTPPVQGEVDDFPKAEKKYKLKVKKFKEEMVAFKETCSQISLDDCFKLFHQSHGVADYDCSVCNEKTILLETFSVYNFPKFLITTLRRQVYDNWVPRKLAHHILVAGDPKYADAVSSLSTDDSSSHFIPSTDILVLDDIRSKGGLQEGETLFPQSDEVSTSTAPQTQKGPTPSPEIISAVMGLGASENAAKRAALAVQNASADHAAMWYFENQGNADINDPIEKPAGTASGKLVLNTEEEGKVTTMMPMGFPRKACIRALQENGWSPDTATNWLFGKMEELDTLEPILPDPEEEEEEASSSETLALDTLPAKYKLIGYVNHKGLSVGSGHYIATLSRSFVDPTWKGEAQWVVFDDEKVFITKNPLMSQSYQLLFQRL